MTKILVKSVIMGRGGDERSSGKIDLDKLSAFVAEIVNNDYNSDEFDQAFEDLGEYIGENCSWASLFDWEHDGEDMVKFLQESVTKLKNGESVGCSDEETVTAFIPMIKKDNELRVDAAKRVNLEGDALIAQLLSNGQEDDGVEFDQDDWD